MLKKRIFPGIVILFLVALVVGLFLLPGPTRSNEQPPEERITDVSVMEVQPVELTDSMDLPATVEPFLLTEVSAEVGGRIDWIGPKEGSSVSKGAPLIRIDQRTFRAQVEEAQAAYDLAVNNCKRIEELFDDGIISRDKLDQCEAAVSTSSAKLEMAKLQLDKAEILSPIAGVLNKIYYEEGEFVKQGEKVADLVVIDPIKVVAKIPERDISFVRLGKTADISFGMLGGKRYEGAVSYISVVGDPGTRTYEVEITVSNPAHKILPAMIGRVEIVRQKIENAVTVPLFSVIPKGDFKSIFVEKDGHAEERQVRLGVLQGNRVQILDGLKPQERLIVEGHRELSDGEAVRVQRIAGDAS